MSYYEKPYLYEKEQESRAVLYDHKGKPLMWPKRKLGFQPPEEKVKNEQR